MSKLLLLKTEKDFSSFRQSKAFQTPLLMLRVHFGPHQNFPRFGFIVPKKVLSKAAHRNQIKRRLKAILTKAQPRLKPADLLFFPRAGLLKLQFAEVEQMVLKLFTNAKLWKS